MTAPKVFVFSPQDKIFADAEVAGNIYAELQAHGCALAFGDEAWQHADPGNEAAMAAMTVAPAIIFDLGPGFGTIEENGRADIVIWSGDPLEVTSAADLVIIDGRQLDMISRQTLLRDRYLPENPDLPRAYIKP